MGLFFPGLLALHLAGVHSFGKWFVEVCGASWRSTWRSEQRRAWVGLLLTFLFYVCHVYCWLVEESRDGHLYLVSRDETGNDRALGTRGQAAVVSFVCGVFPCFFWLALMFSARAFDIWRLC